VFCKKLEVAGIFNAWAKTKVAFTRYMLSDWLKGFRFTVIKRLMVVDGWYVHMFSEFWTVYIRAKKCT